MTRDIPLFIILVGLTFLLALPAFCQTGEDPLCITADRQFSYAQDLFNGKEYTLAQVELARFIEFFPDDPRLWQARFTLGVCRLESGNLAYAKHSFEDLINDESSGAWGIEACFMMAKLHQRTGNPVLGEICLKNLLTLTRDSGIRDRVYSAMAWMRLETAQWDSGKAYLTRISEKNKETYHVAAILAGLEKTGEIPRKSPKLAGALSIVPGAGYLYCGRYRDALVSFLLNGGLILAAYESFDHDHHALGGVITFVGFGFYAGNIYGSAASAHKYNRAANRDFISRLKNQTIPSASLGLWHKPTQPVGLAVQCHF